MGVVFAVVLGRFPWKISPQASKQPNLPSWQAVGWWAQRGIWHLLSTKSCSRSRQDFGCSELELHFPVGIGILLDAPTSSASSRRSAELLPFPAFPYCHLILVAFADPHPPGSTFLVTFKWQRAVSTPPAMHSDLWGARSFLYIQLWTPGSSYVSSDWSWLK